MASQPNSRPSFFKVIIGDFGTKLQLPPFFVKTYKERFIENPVLKTTCGKSWVVSMEKTNEKYWFTTGWPEFVEANKLLVGDFCVFWLNGDSTFEVSVYGRNCCEKQLDVIEIGRKKTVVSVNNSPTISEEDEEGDDVGEAMTTLSYERILNKYNISFCSLPVRFAKGIGIVREKKMVLRDPEERLWPVKLVVRHTSGGRVDIMHGWSDFRLGNKLAIGDTCFFKFIPSAHNVLHVQICHRDRGKSLKPEKI
ncbi:unnamed protein product [Ilex paraguariensis]|uniref:TF-B3 domain-containing protein n=1 Tax=Ilex paraguariensis TaxID=185542 RepID=A0ABC8RC56_9AQUA